MSRIVQLARAVGRAIGTAIRAIRGNLAKPTGLAPLGPMLLSRGRIGGDIDPQQVSQILLNADQGYLRGICDLFDESRQRDCHLHAVCANFELSLAASEVQVTPTSSRLKDRKLARSVEDMLTNFGADADDGLDLYGLIEHLARGYWYDHSVSEILYERTGGQLWPFTAQPIAARRFCRSQFDGKLRFWDEAGGMPYPGIDLKKTYPNRFIQFEPRVTGGGPNREGLMVLLVWAALFRNWTIKDWLQLGELAWKPWRIGYYDKAALNENMNSAGRKDIQDLELALQSLVSTGATMLPNTVKLQVEYPQKTGSGGDGQHYALASFMAAEMSKAALGSTQTVEEGNRGTARTAGTHENTTRGRRSAGLRNVAGVIRRDLVTPFVRLNYGADVAVPQISLVPDETLDMAVLSKSVSELVSAGAPISLAWVLKKLGAPMPKPGEFIIGNAQPAQIAMPEQSKPKKRIPVRVITNRMAA